MRTAYAGIVREFKTYAKYLFSKKIRPNSRFVIFGPGRSGSTLLADLLNACPHICCEDEILHYKVLFPGLYVRCCEALGDSNVYGFKLLSYQLQQVQKLNAGEFVRFLTGAGYRIIYLRRDNIFRHAISNLYARHRQSFHHRSHDAPLQQLKMTVELDELLFWMQGIKRMQVFENEVLHNLPYLELVYEKDLQDCQTHQKTADKVTSYLGVAPATVTTDLVKITPTDLAEILVNYEEVVDYVRQTEFAGFLERS